MSGFICFFNKLYVIYRKLGVFIGDFSLVWFGKLGTGELPKADRQETVLGVSQRGQVCALLPVFR